MPSLTIDTAYDEPGSGVSTDPEGWVGIQEVINGTPEAFPAEHHLSAGVLTVELTPGYYWVHRYGYSKLVYFTVDARLDQLPPINPETLEPGVEPEPVSAWHAELALRPILTRLTQAEYDALDPEEQADPLKLYVIPAT